MIASAWMLRRGILEIEQNQLKDRPQHEEAYREIDRPVALLARLLAGLLAETQQRLVSVAPVQPVQPVSPGISRFRARRPALALGPLSSLRSSLPYLDSRDP